MAQEYEVSGPVTSGERADRGFIPLVLPQFPPLKVPPPPEDFMIFLKNTTSWKSSVQTHESVGGNSHSNHSIWAPCVWVYGLLAFLLFRG